MVFIKGGYVSVLSDIIIITVALNFSISLYVTLDKGVCTVNVNRDSFSLFAK